MAARAGGARVCRPGGRHRTGGRARRGTGGAPEAAAIWLDERMELWRLVDGQPPPL